MGVSTVSVGGKSFEGRARGYVTRTQLRRLRPAFAQPQLRRTISRRVAFLCGAGPELRQQCGSDMFSRHQRRTHFTRTIRVEEVGRRRLQPRSRCRCRSSYMGITLLANYDFSDVQGLFPANIKQSLSFVARAVGDRQRGRCRAELTVRLMPASRSPAPPGRDPLRPRSRTVNRSTVPPSVERHLQPQQQQQQPRLLARRAGREG